jgi:hypothetical protein
MNDTSQDPERWIDDPAAAPRGAIELLRAARPPARPSAEMRQRLGMELHGMSVAGRLGPPRWPFAVGSALVIAAGVAGWLALSSGSAEKGGAPGVAPVRPPAARSEMSPIRLAAAEPLAAPAAALEPARPSPPALEPAPVPRPSPRVSLPHRLAPRATVMRAGPRHARPVAAPAAAGDSLAREASLVEEARRTVHTRPTAALQMLETHRREFPSGQLTAEREFLTVAALVQLGRRVEAEARSRRLIAEYPGSTYAQQVPAVLARGPR